MHVWAIGFADIFDFPVMMNDVHASFVAHLTQTGFRPLLAFTGNRNRTAGIQYFSSIRQVDLNREFHSGQSQHGRIMTNFAVLVRGVVLIERDVTGAFGGEGLMGD